MVDVNVNFILGNDEPLRADFELQPDVTYTADIKLSEATRDHTKLYNRDRANQHPMGAITGLEDALEGLSGDITAEYNRAVEAEETLDNKIDSEVDTRVDEITRVEGLISDEETRAKSVEQDLASSIDSNHQAISDHVSNKNNPHEVTKTQVGLGNVDNTSDSDKPVSTATQAALDSKVDKTTTADRVYGTDSSGNQTTYNVDSFGKVDDVKVGGVSVVTNKIANLGTMAGETASDYYTASESDSRFATSAQGTLADTALQPNDNISELTNNLGYQTATQVANSIAVETNNRELADNGLQSQIDAIVSSSDVFDIVGTYAELQAYDISTVPVNDIIKVLVDSTHSGAATYYRCVETGGVKSWSYIGSEGAYYTKGEADSKFVPQTRTVNNKALSSDITLTATDVGALPSSTVIPTVNDGQLDIQVNGSSVATFTANQSGDTTANIVVPDSATWGNITGDIEDQTDLQDALDEKQDVLTAGTDLEIVEGSILPNSYTQLTSITSTGTQWINSGIKLTNSFKSIIVGRLTGTPSANFRTILGAVNSNMSTGKQNVLLGWGNSSNGFYAEPCLAPSYTYSSYPWDTNTHTFTTTVNPTVTLLNIDGVVDTINSAPSITGVNLAIFARLAQNDTVNSQVNFELNSIELYQSGSLVFKGVPAKRNSDDEIGLYDTVSGSFFSNSGTGDFTAGSEVPASTVINFTNDTGYITGINSTDVTTALGYIPVNPSSLATVATSGDYDDLTNKPTIPTVGDGTITITQGGVNKGSFTLNQSSGATIALDAGGAGGIQNTATGTDSLTILGNATSYGDSINIGDYSSANGGYAVAIGGQSGDAYYAEASANGTSVGAGAGASSGSVAVGYQAQTGGSDNIAVGRDTYIDSDASSSVAIGNGASVTGEGNTIANSIQLGSGTNSTANSLQVGSYELLDTSTGLIPDARISTNIARTSAIPTVDQTYDGTSTNAQSGTAVASAISTKQDSATALTTTNTYYDSATSTLYIG